MVARQREVRGLVAAEVLPGNDVLDVQTVKRLVFLPDPAVFAPVTSTPSNQFSRLLVHQAAGLRDSIARAFIWRMAITLAA